MTQEPVRPDTIEVQAQIEDEVEASYADLHVSVKGSTLVFGNAALEKAREVSALVKALASAGISQEDIHVEDVAAEVTSGLLTKSSSATYSLSVRCKHLESLPEVLGTVAAQKNVQLQQAEWGFPIDDARRTSWLVQCAKIAGDRAQKIADALGVKLLGVHRFAEPSIAPEREQARPTAAPGVAMRRAVAPDLDLGLSISHSRKITVRAAVEYRVSPLG